MARKPQKNPNFPDKPPDCPKCKGPMMLMSQLYEGFMMGKDDEYGPISDEAAFESERRYLCEGCKVYVEVKRTPPPGKHK